jgi:hypothetical protein
MVPALSIMFSVINELIANGTAIRRGSTLPAARAVADIQMPFVNEKAAPMRAADGSWSLVCQIRPLRLLRPPA